VRSDLALDSSEGFSSSPHTLLKHYTFKHLTGQGESDAYIPEYKMENIISDGLIVSLTMTQTESWTSIGSL